MDVAITAVLQENNGFKKLPTKIPWGFRFYFFVSLYFFFFTINLSRKPQLLKRKDLPLLVLFFNVKRAPTKVAGAQGVEGFSCL
ncbi:MAG: hypothetical protein HOB17_10250 [Candidatus Marinimicrobia bacterium]|jgi:hypothetical protein|nr:hypothetical protein [Candidatus Neomarinimicrobiota bacterium]MBT3760903.1 hypothetical protein [Candidatus Neomarinimicrobiota bacterium]MBT3896950.1 hypothetical protein [Candidatus Neomarinimicrobiota bacterium]MBT4538603.1 hypothetical protein [Candidatus Neomarinimicrobiota bacterium]MBT4853034.1 hypothetical protein [Candidatus Neomarinimicrobiota bacterium]